MASTRHLKIFALALATGASFLPSEARADSTPIVHGIPATPLTAVRAYRGKISIVLDAAPPASVQFYFDIPVGDPNAMGFLDVWPLAEDGGNGAQCTKPPLQGRQSYHLGMGTTKEVDSWYLRATVPALQVGQKFCFSMTPRLAPSASEMGVIAAKVGREILSAVPDGKGQCKLSAKRLSAWLADALGLDPTDERQKNAADQLTPAGEVAEIAYDTNVMGQCLAYRTAAASYDAAQQALSNPASGSSSFADANEAEQKASATLAPALQAFKTAIPSTFTDAVRTAIVVTAMNITLDGVAGEGATPPAANYGSADAGAFVAFPSGGAQRDVWLVPYLGLNLYSTPVDRTITLSELTGSWLDRLRQRLSLTIGVTLSTPSIAGRSLSAPFLSHYPVVALGLRLSNYSRVTAGAVIYDLADANPASAAHTLVAAPFVGAALDIDLIHLLTQAKP
jgi:hypothetical protein